MIVQCSKECENYVQRSRTCRRRTPNVVPIIQTAYIIHMRIDSTLRKLLTKVHLLKPAEAMLRVCLCIQRPARVATSVDE